MTVTAYQFGDSTYAPATPVAHSFNVKPVMLTVTANSFSCEAGQITTCLAANPLSYAISGFVSGDTQAVVSGTATLTTSVVASSPAGAYPITFATENLVAANYSFNYVPGTLTVAGDEAQTINLRAAAECDLWDESDLAERDGKLGFACELHRKRACHRGRQCGDGDRRGCGRG